MGDLGKIVKKHSQWQNIVAQIKPFYTVKCNSTPAVLEILAALGTGFACSSKVSHFHYFVIELQHFKIDRVWWGFPIGSVAEKSTCQCWRLGVNP